MSSDLLSLGVIPCVIFEDEHLLVVNKPAGWNTHAPGPHAGEGIYDWLRQREPRWVNLSIIHWLDKETSGVSVFGKTTLANHSLTQQFTEHRVRKRYLLHTDRAVPRQSWEISTRLVRRGSRYASTSDGRTGDLAETRFEVITHSKGRTLLRAEPRTGRTHQIRAHAAESGIPVLGDTVYGGSAFQRVCLHAESITLEHPESGEPCTFSVEPQFEADARQAMRAALVNVEESDALRLIHGASDGWPGWYVDRFGNHLLSQSERELDLNHREELERLLSQTGTLGAYHKCLSRHVRRSSPGEACPQRVMAEPAPDHFTIRENGLRYEVSFTEGYSVGLFLDQRDNRRRLLTGHIAAGFPAFAATADVEPFELLNTFAYTCAFSVCAAKRGARVTSLDLSRKYLDWGRRNFNLNELDPDDHDFIYGDAFDWMKRLHKKGRTFDAVIMDPPTFSQSKQSGMFRAERDYGKLVAAAVALLRPNGILLASTNAAGWMPATFLEVVHGAIRTHGRQVLKEHYCPQAPDFPVCRDEPAYLKTVWLRLD